MHAKNFVKPRFHIINSMGRVNNNKKNVWKRKKGPWEHAFARACATCKGCEWLGRAPSGTTSRHAPSHVSIRVSARTPTAAGLSPAAHRCAVHRPPPSCAPFRQPRAPMLPVPLPAVVPAAPLLAPPSPQSGRYPSGEAQVGPVQTQGRSHQPTAQSHQPTAQSHQPTAQSH